MVTAATCATPLAVAVIVTDVTVVTGDVENVALAVVMPLATVTLAGTVTADALAVRAIVRPDAGAGPSSVTVTVPVAPPVSVVGAIVSAAG